MHTIKVLLGIGLLGIISVVLVCLVSPQIFTKAAYALVKLEFADVPEFSSRSLHQLIASSNSEHVIVDVRTVEERNVSIIPGAIDQAYFERHLSDYRDQKVIVYCTIGYRSGFFARSLRQKGVDAYNLRAGILGWTHVGGRLLNLSGQETNAVHVYSRPWHLAVKNYTAVY